MSCGTTGCCTKANLFEFEEPRGLSDHCFMSAKKTRVSYHGMRLLLLLLNYW